MKIKLYFFIAPLLSILLFNSCSNYHKIFRKPAIYDGDRFGKMPLPASEDEPFLFSKSNENVEIPDVSLWGNKEVLKRFESSNYLLNNSETDAFIIIRNDSIIYENYFNGRTEKTTSQVFSITKPLIVSLLMQAEEEGRIESIDDKVNQYFPVEKHNKNCEELTLKHLAQMQSGFNHYDYFRIFKISKLYHAKNVDDYITKARVSRAPGGDFKYKSFDTQFLGACLERIFDEENLLDRFSNLYWKNIRPENPGFFNIDSEETNNMKYYGGLNITARDLAKIGKIYLNDGKFEDKQIISEEWMDYLLDTTNHFGKWDYNLGWYFDAYEEDNPVFYASGYHGQYLLLNKKTNTIIVRLGETNAKLEWFDILADLSALF